MAKVLSIIMISNKSINIDEKFDLKLASLLIENGECLSNQNSRNKVIKNIKNFLNIIVITKLLNF